MNTTISSAVFYNVTVRDNNFKDRKYNRLAYQQVSVGLNILYSVGTLQYTPNGNTIIGAFPVAAVAGSVAGGVAGILLTVTLVLSAIVVAHRRDSLKKSYQIQVLMSQVKTQEENTKEMKSTSNLLELIFILH